MVLEDGIESQSLPELEADMDGPGGSHVGHSDAVGVDGDEFAVDVGPWRRVGVVMVGVGLALPDLADDLLDFGIGLGEEVGLTDEGIFDFAGQAQPFLGGPGAEVTERADDLLARALGSMDGLNQQIVGISSILVPAGGLSHVHSHYVNAPSVRIQVRPRGISHYNGLGPGKNRRKQGARVCRYPQN